MTRVVRVREEKEVKVKKGAKELTPEQLLALDMIEIAGKIASVKGEIDTEVARVAIPLREEAGKLQIKYGECKEKLLALMKKKKITEFSVNNMEVYAKSKTVTDINPEDLWKYFQKIKDQKKFFQFVSVRITDAKKFIGEVILKNFWKQDTTNYTDIDIKSGKEIKTRVKKK